MIDIEAGETAESVDDLYPNPAILIGGAGAIGLISALSLPWPAASEFIVVDPAGATSDVA
jgi:threonine dehydrogenase-like Zn-dependent dehydrogenase